jgi:hypothetical protein
MLYTMSGYPLKTPYDGDIKRKKYVQELELRARLDDENLQANKLYKRTGAIATPPDNRTTSEKLADTFRLRIDIRSKLGQLMSGDEAQKVVNKLDQEQLVFLAGRIDKYIAELKPKYALGMPYQVFMSYFNDAVRNFLAYGDVETSRAVLEQMSATSEETKFAIDNLTREIQLSSGKGRELIFNMDNIRKLLDLVGRGQQLLDGSQINPAIEDQVGDAINAITQVVPTKQQLITYQNNFEQAVRLGDVRQQEQIAKQLEQTLTGIDSLKNNIDDLQRVVSETTRQLPSVPLTKQNLQTQELITEYISPYEPNKNYKIAEANELFLKMFELIASSEEKKNIWNGIVNNTRLNYNIELSGVNRGGTLRQKISVNGFDSLTGIKAVNHFVDTYSDEFKLIFSTGETKIIPQNINPFNRTEISDYTKFQSKPSGPIAPPILPPTPPPPVAKKVIKIKNIYGLFLKKRNNDIVPLMQQIENEDNTWNEDRIKNSINNFTVDGAFNVYNINDGGDQTILTNYGVDWLNYVLIELVGGAQPIEFTDFVIHKQSASATGKGLGKKSRRMKGGSIRIDLDAGMKDDINVPKYVPFGRYIINRNKLNDGVIMIKRPSGAFMGDLQSRRVSNKLKSVFDKIIGGSVPSYQDFAKLDEDEKQYLHYVAKKSNLLDKLQVPTPNKDEEEKMINRFEILRGQIVAGNDSRELIKEFKKLIMEMGDKKLLPRRQISDILIDIERVYG